MRRSLVLVCVLGVVVLAYLRLYYGVDLTDESFYVAVPYRFVTGAKPYVDEISVQQTGTGILLAPLVWLWDTLVGRGGIVLFVRHVHFLVALALGGVVFASLRRYVAEVSAVFIAVAAFLFSPFAIPSVGYDSLAAALFAAGCLLDGIAGGVCLGLAAFTYPPLAIGVLAACAVRRQLRVAAPALGLPALGFAVLAAVAGPGTIVRDYRDSAHFLAEGGGLAKLRNIPAHEWHTFPYWWVALAGLVLCAVLWRRSVAVVLLALAPIAFVPAKLGSYSASLEFVSHLAWLAVPLVVALRDDEPSRRLFRIAWVPGLVGGAVTAYSSNNGGVNSGVGFLPGALVALALAARAISLRRPSLGYVPCAVAAALLVWFSLVPVYRDAPLGSLDARVHSGPYAGLFTTPRKRRFLTGLEHDLAGVSARCRIAFFADFPAGYLLTPAHADTNAAWTARVAPAKAVPYRRLLVAYWRRHDLPDVAVLMRRIPFAPPRSGRDEHYLIGDPLLGALKAYTLTTSRPDYEVFRRDSCA